MNVDEMQKKLSQKAEKEPEHQFENLYGLLCNGYPRKAGHLCSQARSAIACGRCRGRGKSSLGANTVSQRSGKPRLNNRAAGVVPSAARPSQ